MRTTPLTRHMCVDCRPYVTLYNVVVTCSVTIGGSTIADLGGDPTKLLIFSDTVGAEDIPLVSE